MIRDPATEVVAVTDAELGLDGSAVLVVIASGGRQIGCGGRSPCRFRVGARRAGR